MNTQTKNSLLLLLCSLIWGTAFVAQSAGSGMGAYSFLAGRSWLAVLVLIPTVLYALTFFRYRENPREKWLTFSGITLVCCVSMLGNEPIWSGLFQLGIFLVIPLIQYCYNGESGSKKPFHKWFFYVFYPLHLLVLGILRWVVFA